MVEREFVHLLTMERYVKIDDDWFKVRGIYLDPCREPIGVQETFH